MFLRPHYRTVDGKRHAYWSLVESVRTERGPRQRVVAYLGGLDEASRLGVQQAAAPNSTTDNQPSLFEDESTQPRYVDVDVSKVRVENCREFGGPWLAWQLIRRLGLDEFLHQTIPRGDEEIRWSVMSLVLVIARLCRPSSELHIAEHFYRQTALSDLLGVPDAKVNDARLYRTLDALSPHKEALETFLKNRLGTLNHTVRFGVRPVVVRCDQHVLRRQSRGESTGTARLFTRPAIGLQAGLHRSGRLAVRDAAGL